MTGLASDVNLVRHMIVNPTVPHETDSCMTVNTIHVRFAEMDIRREIQKKPVPRQTPAAQVGSFIGCTITGGFKSAKIGQPDPRGTVVALHAVFGRDSCGQSGMFKPTLCRGSSLIDLNDMAITAPPASFADFPFVTAPFLP